MNRRNFNPIALAALAAAIGAVFSVGGCRGDSAGRAAAVPEATPAVADWFGSRESS